MTTETLHLVLELAAGVIAVALAVIGYLAVRAINNVDRSVAELKADIKALATGDTEVKVKLKEIEVRVVAVEAEVVSLRAALSASR